MRSTSLLINLRSEGWLVLVNNLRHKISCDQSGVLVEHVANLRRYYDAETSSPRWKHKPLSFGIGEFIVIQNGFEELFINSLIKSFEIC